MGKINPECMGAIGQGYGTAMRVQMSEAHQVRLFLITLEHVKTHYFSKEWRRVTKSAGHNTYGVGGKS